MLERFRPTTELSLKLQQLGIEGAVFDLDDTLLETNALFLQAIDSYLTAVAADLHCYTEGLRPRFMELNTAAFHGPAKVSPERWDEVINGLIKTYGHPEIFQKHRSILYDIYHQAPPYLRQAKSTLRILKETGLPLGLVTHANQEWTNRKIDTRGLADFFDPIWVADQYQPKSETDWAKALALLNVQPHQCLGIGDSIASDMIPLSRLGVRYRVLIPSPWSVYREGDIPNGTKSIDGIHQLIDTLMNW
jgi:FMN phosphatase YigB (HAD superfamily)